MLIIQDKLLGHAEVSVAAPGLKRCRGGERFRGGVSGTVMVRGAVV